MALILHYHPLSSYCWKVLIALYEKELAFEPRIVDFANPEARARFASLWPTAKIPLLEDDGKIVPETSIMIEHLDRHHQGACRMLPDDPEERLKARLWDRLFDNEVMTPMQRYVAQHFRPEAERDAATLDDCTDQIGRAYAMIESLFGDRRWAAGEQFSIADCAAAPSLFYASVIRPFGAGDARLSGYFDRLLERPSVRRAIDGARPVFQYFPLKDRLPPQYRA